jgi:ESCRT-I complex subunit VPS28
MTSISAAASDSISSSGRSSGSGSFTASSSHGTVGKPVRLYENSRERKTYTELADLYAIFKATEHLEVAYARDAIGKAEYNQACSKLLQQYKGARQAIDADDRVSSVEQFLDVYKADCPRETKRLLVDMVPADVIDPGHSTAQNTGVIVADTVSNFITVIDQLKLGIRAVDELTLCIHDLMANLNRTVGVPEDFEPKRKVHHWVTVLSTLGASDQISEDQARQIELDMQTSYQTYFAFLGHGQKKQGMQ